MKRKNKKSLKVVSKKRFILNTLVILFMIILVSFFTTKSFGKKEIHTYEYTVSSTDTLWNISNVVCKNSDDKNINIQNVIKDIKSRNNLSDSDIYVGQVLNIPIY